MASYLLVLMCVPVLCTGAARGLEAVRDTSFTQLSSLRYTFGRTIPLAQWGNFPSIPPGGLTAVAAGENGTAWLLGTAGLYAFNSGEVTRVDRKWGVDITGLARLAVGGGRVTVATSHGVYRCHPPTCSLVPYPMGNASVAGLACAEEVCYVIAGAAVVKVAGGVGETVTIPGMDTPLAVAVRGSMVVVCDRYRVWLSKKAGEWEYLWSAALSHYPMRSVVFTQDGSLFLANNESLYFRNATDTTLTRIDQRRGLPFNMTADLSSPAAVPSGIVLWVATAAGVVRFNPSPPETIVWGSPHGARSPSFPALGREAFRYFHGPRWLPTRVAYGEGCAVVSISASPDGNDVYALTNEGLAWFRSRSMTLSSKAAHFDAMVRPRHDRYGLVADCSLDRWGDLSSYRLRSSDNDGLWTAMYLASQCFRYAVTGSHEARDNAWRSFYALQLLNNVTGVEGLMARSILPVNATPPGGVWHPSPTYPNLQWKGDTSSDEVTGHFFAYAIMLRLVAHTDLEKETVRGLQERIIKYIVKNGYRLIDVTGEPTRWGRWDPPHINDNMTWFDQRGLNSLQILSWLHSTANTTTDEGTRRMLEEAITHLDQHGYTANIPNTKITIPDDDNFSDDELAFLPYYTWCFAAPPSSPSPLADAFHASLSRSWAVRAEERGALWNVIFRVCGRAVPPTLLPDAVWDLQRWPLELIDWPYNNTQRLDVSLDPFTSRGQAPVGRELLSRDERRSARWNENPYVLQGGSAMAETDPAPFLLPYWMARYHGVLSPPSPAP